MKLETCPFCGSEAELRQTSSWDYFVRCTNKQCAARTRQFHENRNGAIATWNLRDELIAYRVEYPNKKEPLCSRCWEPIEPQHKYCPNCGARMV